MLCVFNYFDVIGCHICNILLIFSLRLTIGVRCRDVHHAILILSHYTQNYFAGMQKVSNASFSTLKTFSDYSNDILWSFYSSFIFFTLERVVETRLTDTFCYTASFSETQELKNRAGVDVMILVFSFLRFCHKREVFLCVNC